jgi:hypothetical protein
MIKNCEIRKLVNLRKEPPKPKEEINNYLKNLENSKQNESLEFLTKNEIKRLSENQLKNSEQFSMEPRYTSHRIPRDIEDQSSTILKMKKKNRNLKEKLKICEREREIALNALQQQTEHFNREQVQRRKLEEQVEQLEMLLESEHSKANDSNENKDGNRNTYNTSED